MTQGSPDLRDMDKLKDVRALKDLQDELEVGTALSICMGDPSGETLYMSLAGGTALLGAEPT